MRAKDYENMVKEIAEWPKGSEKQKLADGRWNCRDYGVKGPLGTHFAFAFKVQMVVDKYSKATVLLGCKAELFGPSGATQAIEALNSDILKHIPQSC
ncbi:unnamed protein product [Bursaphelenchus xylophilus]|uniref:(pine wood nematode) hypothetical protein n=1 Tax=Bursaphelenchus xylophilus TaxID=6326 RepID=A0A1I7RKN3_BURXY|nr:unnamed protein product [Bursaphelenchus xylophilus]CAG9131208.1 unnamed protein product [Bursaphelenchus xylophilus]